MSGIEDKLLLNQDKQQVYEIINNLNEHLKKIVLLRIKYDLTFKQIGKIIGKSENYVRVTYYRIKEKIKKEIKQGGIKNE